MKTTNLIKKAAGLILAFVTASTLTMPAFALATEPDIQSRASGNGWVTTAIVKNGVSYVLNGGIGSAKRWNIKRGIHIFGRRSA